MKKVILFTSVIFLLQYTVLAQNIFFPDLNFKNKLLIADVDNQIARNCSNQATIIDTNSNGEISLGEAQNVCSLNLYNSNISDLTGIEYFINLTNLSVYLNNLNILDLQFLTNLKTLNCFFNNLSSLNLSGLILLEKLQLNSNNFTSFNTSNLPNLKEFQCSNNQITSLDFSNNLQLKELVCSNNNLTSLNIKNGSNELLGAASVWNDCWAVGNPNLTTICADNNEVVAVQNFVASCSLGAQPTVNSSCGLANEKFSKNDILVFPNPCNSFVTINAYENIKSLQLLDSQSRVLLTQTIDYITTSLDVSSYNTGVYFIKIDTNDGSEIKKIIKK